MNRPQVYSIGRRSIERYASISASFQELSVAPTSCECHFFSQRLLLLSRGRVPPKSPDTLHPTFKFETYVVNSDAIPVRDWRKGVQQKKTVTPEALNPDALH